MSKEAPQIDPKNTWIISDTHWGHQNIIGFCNRPSDHEQIMMEQWAQAVPAAATVLHLGDLSYRNNAFFKNMIAPHLTGERKLLIKGNHDHSRPVFYRDSGFKIVPPFEIKFENHSVSFSHYPLREKRHPTHIHVHGHIHNNGYGGKDAPFVPFSAGQINVSVEQIHYTPVNLDQLLKGYIHGCYEPKEKR